MKKSVFRFGLFVSIPVVFVALILIAHKLEYVNLPALQSIRNIYHSIRQTVSVDNPPTLQETPAVTPVKDIEEMVGKVNKDRALTDLRRLTGEEKICIDAACYTIGNRLTGSEGLQWTKDYISKELVRQGYSVEIQDWSLEGKADQNIIARKAGMTSQTEEIYFVAHMDSVGTPAADDDGSGVIDLLELARVLSGYSFDRTVVLLLTTGEEEGRLGSRYYLDGLSQEELCSIKYAVDLDMVGYDANEDGVMELWHGGDPSSLQLTQVLSEIVGAYHFDLSPVLVTGCG